MMRIYTGSFSKLKTIPKEMLKVNISKWAPKWASFLNYPNLYPPVDLLLGYKDGEISKEDYTIRYNNEVLSKLNLSEVLIELKELSGGNDIVLLCYESAGDFCHRQLVAKWFNDNGNLNVVEWIK